MPENEYQIIVRLPKSNGFSTKNDRHLAEIVERAIRDGLRDRYVETDHISIEKVPPPRDYADLPVGTRVLVTPFPVEEREPYAARVYGYDIHHSKYRLDREIWSGEYTTDGIYWAFANQVEVHPDGPSTSKES